MNVVTPRIKVTRPKNSLLQRRAKCQVRRSGYTSEYPATNLHLNRYAEGEKLRVETTNIYCLKWHNHDEAARPARGKKRWLENTSLILKPLIWRHTPYSEDMFGNSQKWRRNMVTIDREITHSKLFYSKDLKSSVVRFTYGYVFVLWIPSRKM